MQLQSFWRQFSAVSICFSYVYGACQFCDAQASEGHLALVQRQASITSTNTKEMELERCTENETKEAIDALNGEDLRPVQKFTKFFSDSKVGVMYVTDQFDREGRDKKKCVLGKAKYTSEGFPGLHIKTSNTGWLSGGKAYGGMNHEEITWQGTSNHAVVAPDCCAKVPYSGFHPKLADKRKATLFTSDTGVNRTYDLHVPDKCKHTKCPLNVFLNGTDQGVVNDMLGCPSCKAKLGVITLLPYLGAQDAWHDANEDWRSQDTMEGYLRPLVLEILRTYNMNIDRSRVYVSGHSMGGVGALYAALSMPDLFSHAFAFSPTDFGAPYTLSAIGKNIRGLWNTRSRQSKMLKSLHLTLGGMDLIPPSRYAALRSRDLDWYGTASFLQSLGVPAKVYVEMHLELGLAHNTWVSSLNKPKFFSKFWEGNHP